MRLFYALGICFFLLLPGAAWAQEKQPRQENHSTQTAPSSAKAPAAPHVFVFTPEEKARKNPVAFTGESVEKGKSLYMTQCAMCHGKTGNGKGDLATVMHVFPPDFNQPATLSKRTDGELFAIIDKGSSSMPAEAKRLKENQIWDLVNFLRSMQGEKPAKASKATPPGGVQP